MHVKKKKKKLLVVKNNILEINIKFIKIYDYSLT